MLEAWPIDGWHVNRADSLPVRSHLTRHQPRPGLTTHEVRTKEGNEKHYIWTVNEDANVTLQLRDK